MGRHIQTSLKKCVNLNVNALFFTLGEKLLGAFLFKNSSWSRKKSIIQGVSIKK